MTGLSVKLYTCCTFAPAGLELCGRQPTCVNPVPVSRTLPAPVLRLLTFVALGVLAGPTYADADLWGHVRFGLDILSAGHLPSVDPYSFTSDVM